MDRSFDPFFIEGTTMKSETADTTKATEPKSGLHAILALIHSPACGLSKNAQRVAVCVGWHMGPRAEARVGLVDIVKESHLGRSAVVRALSELCGSGGPFVSVKGGPGVVNLYRLKSRKTAGNPTGKTAGFPTGKTAGKLDF